MFSYLRRAVIDIMSDLVPHTSILVATFKELLQVPTRQNLDATRLIVKGTFEDTERQLFGFLVIKAIRDNLHCLATCLRQDERHWPACEFKQGPEGPASCYTAILDSVHYTLKQQLDKIMDLIQVLIDEQCYEFDMYHNMLVRHPL